MSTPSLAPAQADAGAGVRFVNETVRLVTDTKLELYNVTDRVAEVVRRHGIRDGLVVVSSLHTTLALFVNEWQGALLHDIKAMLQGVISADGGWRHNDPQYSDCDRQNAHAHLQATLLGHALTFPVSNGSIVLGTFQAIVAAELDGPRTRDLAVHVFGR